MSKPSLVEPRLPRRRVRPMTPGIHVGQAIREAPRASRHGRQARFGWTISGVTHVAVLAALLLAADATQLAELDSRSGRTWIDSAASASVAAPALTASTVLVVEAPVEPPSEASIELTLVDQPPREPEPIEPPPRPRAAPERPQAMQLPPADKLLPGEPAPEALEETAEVAATPEVAEPPSEPVATSEPPLEKPPEKTDEPIAPAPAPQSSQGSAGSTSILPGVETEVAAEFDGNLPPRYPAEAIARRLAGTVLLRLHVTAEGQVDRVDVVRSSGHAVLDRSASEAIARWRARPARRLGVPVASTTLLPVRFELQ